MLIRLLAFALWLAPLGMTAELIYVYRVPLEHWFYIFTPEIWNWQIIAVSIISPLVGCAVWTAHRWGYWALVAYAILLMANNLAIWAFDRALSPIGLRIVMVAGIVAMAVLMARREFMAPYFNPRLRWWEQAHRFTGERFHMTLKEFGTGKVMFDTDSFDVSMRGCFIASNHPARVGEVFGFEIRLPGGTVFHASGEVVWAHPGGGGTPQGFGCRFLTVEPNFRRRMRQAIRHLHLHARKNR
jgi:hypothetical protein